MKISAKIKSTFNNQETVVQTNDSAKEMQISVKSTGFGSSINGGEFLLLSLATCFCNDVYREAARRKMNISSVDVKVSGEFGKEGEPGKNIMYDVKIQSSESSQEEIAELINHVDRIAEIHNTLRKGVSVSLKI